MNARQLNKLGVPDTCIKEALHVVQKVSVYNKSAEKKQNLQRVIEEAAKKPEEVPTNAPFGLYQLASAIIEEKNFKRPEPIQYKVWGDEYIDQGSRGQMEAACSMPNAVGAALMPDAHIGYGLPIGGVLALENAVAPYAVGVDIACRMKMSVLDIEIDRLESAKDDQSKEFPWFKESLEKGTVFGVGIGHNKKQKHDVMDKDWSVSPITKNNKDKAWKQLGTSGSGNHFVEFGVLTISAQNELGLKPGKYVSLLSHSGSRGTGAAVCSHYSGIASKKLPKRYADLGKLAWLDLDTEEGQEYWAAMNLMGDYAAANHDVIHQNVAKLLGVEFILQIENHHNFAWKEFHQNKEVIVHRKGATPAGEGVLGIIPGSMGTPAFVVKGKGNKDSLMSAAHGAGRVMSRKKSKELFNWKEFKNSLKKSGIHVLSAGADEVPVVYKSIEMVMAAQVDLVEAIAKFDPRIVKMCGDGSRPED